MACCNTWSWQPAAAVPLKGFPSAFVLKPNSRCPYRLVGFSSPGGKRGTEKSRAYTLLQARHDWWRSGELVSYEVCGIAASCTRPSLKRRQLGAGNRFNERAESLIFSPKKLPKYKHRVSTTLTNGHACARNHERPFSMEDKRRGHK